MFAEMLPLLVFTTFAGLAAGAYAVDALCGNGRAGSGAAAPARPAAAARPAAGVPAQAQGFAPVQPAYGAPSGARARHAR